MRIRNLRTGIEGVVRDHVGEALIKRGKAEKVKHKPKPKPDSNPAEPSMVTKDEKPKTTGKYKRRDMKAE